MSITVSATSFLGKPLEYARNLIAASSTWQELCDVETAEAAKEFIEYDRTLLDTVPRCVLEIDPDLQLGQIGPAVFSGQASVIAAFYLPITEDYADNPSDMYMEHLNAIGPVLTEIRDLARNASVSNGYLAVRRITAAEHGQLDPDEQNGELVYLSEWSFEHHLV